MPQAFTVKPEPAPEHEDPHAGTEILLGKTLRFGVLTAAAVLVFGVLVYLIRQRGDVSYNQALGRHETIESLTPRALWHGLADFQARSIIMVGILLLILTPIVRVAMTVLLFFRQRDWILVACAGFVLAILIIGLAGLGV